jgi:hypothetical protein
VYQKNAHRTSTIWLFFNIKKAVKLNPNRSRIKNEAFSEYGALPHRPTKGLSGRPLETFGQKYLVFLELSVLLARQLLFLKESA